MHTRVKQILSRLPKAPQHHIAAILLASLTIPILLFLASQLREWWYIAGTLDPKDQIQAKNEALRTAAQVLGGTFFLITAYFTWRSVTTAEKNLLTSQEEQITDRFTKAIEQLGNEKLEIRLGGIYALERIAKDSAKDHWTIIEVLTAYIRENAPQNAESNQDTKSPPTDIQAILTVIGRRTITPERESSNTLDLRQTNLQKSNLQRAQLQKAHFQGTQLQSADLREAQLQEADLSEAQLQGAYLQDAQLQCANLWEAQLQEADLQNAQLQEADLSEAQLQRAKLSDAQLQEATLSNTQLQGAILWRTQLQSAKLWQAQLQGAKLWEAQLQDAVLIAAQLQGADLSEAQLQGANLSEAQLEGTKFTGASYNHKTRWPDVFIPSDAINTDKQQI